jgi:hypothetical protein
VLVFTLYCVLSLNPAEQGLDQECIHLLRSQATRSWSEADEQYKDVDVSFKMVWLKYKGSIDSAEVYHERERRFVSAPGNKLRLMQSLAADGKFSSQVMNDKYAFAVQRKSTESPFSLSELTKQSFQRTDPDNTQVIWLTVSEMFCRAGFEVFGVPLASIVEDRSKFQLQQAYLMASTKGAGTAAADGRLIHIEGKYLGPAGNNRWQNGIYWADVMAESPFFAVRSGVRPASQVLESMWIEYQHSDIGLFPKVVTRTVGSETEGNMQKYTFEAPARCTLAEEDFYLPHYGISEAVLQTFTTSPYRRWIITINVLAFVIIGVIMWLRRGRGVRQRASTIST